MIVVRELDKPEAGGYGRSKQHAQTISLATGQGLEAYSLAPTTAIRTRAPASFPITKGVSTMKRCSLFDRNASKQPSCKEHVRRTL